MRRSCYILSIGLLAHFALSIYAAEASQQTNSTGDGEKVRTQVAKLDSEEFDEREKARAALLAMGTEALPLLEEVGKAHENDPEIAQQLSRIRAALEVKATAEAQEELAKQLEKCREATDVPAAAARFQAILRKLCAYAPKTDVLLRARACYQAGLCLYNMVNRKGHAKAEFRWPAELLEAAANYYEAASKVDPGNKQLQNDLLETNMVLYASRKYQTP